MSQEQGTLTASGQEDTHVSKRAAGIDAHVAAIEVRRAHFKRFYDFTTGRGLEIGPLDSAVSQRTTDDVRYVDVFDTSGIKAHYADDQNVIVELIPEIDFPMIVDGQARRIAEVAKPGAPYDWVVASHVIEHVPDVIGWLQDLAEVAADGAALVLAVPDRRYCFDRHRPPTTTGQAIEAHELAATRPPSRALYDYFSSVVEVDTAALWRGAPPPGRDARIHGRREAMDAVERGRAGEYIDCHVWTFTPWSLLDQVQDWRNHGLCDWYVDVLEPVPNTVEFFAVLRRANRDGSSLDLEEPVAPSDLPGWLYDESGPLYDRIAKLELKVDNQRERIDRLRAKNEQLRSRLAEVDVPLARRIRSAVARRIGR